MEARVVDNALQTQPDRDALLENRTEKVTFEFVVAYASMGKMYSQPKV